MQDPNEDTEWNDALQKHGIIGAKKEVELTENDIVQMVENTVSEKCNGRQLSDMTLEELDTAEDEEDERVLLQYRQRRIAEMKAAASAAKFGEVREISGQDYVQEVNKAGDGVWVVLHLYKQGIPLCSLINQHLTKLSIKFKAVKFLKSISSTCIADYPDKNLPTIFVYCGGEMKGQVVGPVMFGGMNLTCDELEWMLSRQGALKTDLERDPRPQVTDLLMSQLNGGQKSSSHGCHSSDEDDW